MNKRANKKPPCRAGANIQSNLTLPVRESVMNEARPGFYSVIVQHRKNLYGGYRGNVTTHFHSITYESSAGGYGGNRTLDRWLKRPLLYRLSYVPKFSNKKTKAFC